MTLTPELFVNGTVALALGGMIYQMGRWQSAVEASTEALKESLQGVRKDLKDHTDREERALDAWRTRSDQQHERLIRVEDTLKLRPNEARR